MFARKQKSSDMLQSIQRFSDVHRDPISRVKHLKLLLDSLNVHEKRQLIDDYSFETFHLVDELLLQTEISGNPQAAIEAESGLWTLEQLLCLAPELVGNGWQLHAIESLLKKAIYPHNLLAVRKIAIRLFLIWYQELAVFGKTTPDLDRVFQCLLPYFPLRNGGSTELILQEYCQSAGTVQWTSQSSQTSTSSGGKLTAKERAQMLQVYLDKFLEYCTRETTRIEWNDESHRLECAKFILDKVISLYIHETFPDLETNGVDVFGGWEGAGDSAETLDTADPVIIARYWLIRWINNVAGVTISSNNGTVHPGLMLFHQALFSCAAATNTLLSLQREAMQLPLPCNNVIHKVVSVLAAWLTQQEIPRFVASGAVTADSCSLLVLHVLLSFFHSPYLKQPGDRAQSATSIAFTILKACRDLICRKQLPQPLSTRFWNELIARLCDAGIDVCSSADRFAQETAAAFASTILSAMVIVRAIRGVEVDDKIWDNVHNVFAHGIWMPIATQWAKIAHAVTRAMILHATHVDIFTKEEIEQNAQTPPIPARRGIRSENFGRSMVEPQGEPSPTGGVGDEANSVATDDSADDVVFIDTDDITRNVQTWDGDTTRWICVWKRVMCLLGPQSKGAAVVAVDTIGQTIQHLLTVGLNTLAHWLCSRLLIVPSSILPQCVAPFVHVLSSNKSPPQLQAHILSSLIGLLGSAEQSVVSQLPSMSPRHLSILSPHLLQALPRLSHAPSSDLLKALVLLCGEHSTVESLLLRNLSQADLTLPLYLLCLNALALLIVQRADIELMQRVVDCLRNHRLCAKLLPTFCSSVLPLARFGMSSAVLETLRACAGALRDERMRTEVEWQLVSLCMEGRRREAPNVLCGVLADRQQILEGAMVTLSGQWPLPGFSAAKWNSIDMPLSPSNTINRQEVAFVDRKKVIISVAKNGLCELTCRTPINKHVWSIDQYSLERNQSTAVTDWLKREVAKGRRGGRDGGGILGTMEDPLDALFTRELTPVQPATSLDSESWLQLIQTSKRTPQSLNALHSPPKALPSSRLLEWRSFAATMGFVSAASEVPVNFARDLRHLDSTGAREVHKFAVIYVPPGPMEKQAILSTATHSADFEKFINELGWEVKIGKNHEGYTGGLAVDSLANYWAMPDSEVIFHVSTKLDGEATSKIRHLGNDEVHIVWNENPQRYRRDIIATKFCDVLLIVEAADEHNYRVRIETQSPLEFGPLFDGALVGRSELAYLVRTTAINASRAYRLVRDEHARPLRHRETVFSLDTKRHVHPTHLCEAINSLYIPTMVA
ncbi:unnamed protein product, partial [Mesorhabditis belari]|uniref:Rap-GAP domain-containing protein n=1 Tax=Mesorhabditis belari TaxID=2138241 RepID=A0AAF3EAG3_9BILA